MTPDKLAKRHGFRIRHKRDGRLQLVHSHVSVAPTGTMAGIEAQLDFWRRVHNEGMTFISACGRPMWSTEPAKRRSDHRPDPARSPLPPERKMPTVACPPAPMQCLRSTSQGKPNDDLCLSPQPPCSDRRQPMKKSYVNPSASFDAALNDLVRHCRLDLSDIKDVRAKMNQRLDQAADLHGIDPAAVRRLLKLLQKYDGSDDINYARQEEIDAAYRAIVNGGVPVVPSRKDDELDKVMQLVTNDRPPKIDDIMKAISCSRGKASNLRKLAATRLAAKSSCSSKSRERELSEESVVSAGPDGILSSQEAGRDATN